MNSHPIPHHLSLQSSPIGVRIAYQTPELLTILEQNIPPLADLPEKTEARLFPNPAPQNDEINKDWRALILPELLSDYQSHQDTVRSDIRRACQLSYLLIPPHHLEAWIHTLNQARLYLFEEQNLTENALQNPQTNIHALKIHLLGFLQDYMLHALQTHKS